MHGLINRAIEMFVRDTYGRKAWVALALHCDLGFNEVEAMLTYEDDITLALLHELAREQQKPVETLSEDIGTYLVSHPNCERVRRLLRFSGDNFTEFLRSLDDLPARARLAVPDLILPRLELREHNLQHFSLKVVHGPDLPPVFGHALVGLLRAMADDYGALVVLDHKGGSAGTEVISVDLLEAAFAEGRSFALGQVPG
ncbi:heme NO-binding domain-containing protein [Roseovarius aestuariivivens]|uniref:heme NO-binding domain-containing protein n=1 Tax=Roseovarius aestuariivivens TaxID=1888910 RepID=UPI001080912F|nr:heme NO-binding domain-containing protein [Roseovarius aestuariivivens]